MALVDHSDLLWPHVPYIPTRSFVHSNWSMSESRNSNILQPRHKLKKTNTVQRSCLICNISKGGKKEFVKRLTHTCICVMMHRYSCSKLQLHWYVCIASALVYPLLLPTAQCSQAYAQTADMQPMWTCNCFARAIQSALLHSVYFWFLGCLQLLPVHRYVQLRGN